MASLLKLILELNPLGGLSWTRTTHDFSKAYFIPLRRTVDLSLYPRLNAIFEPPRRTSIVACWTQEIKPWIKCSATTRESCRFSGDLSPQRHCFNSVHAPIDAIQEVAEAKHRTESTRVSPIPQNIPYLPLTGSSFGGTL